MAGCKGSLFGLVYLLASLSASCASNETGCVGCSLPDPRPVNDFLRSHYSIWTNPLLGGQPRALQVEKCQALAPGPAYDFYQPEAPDNNCVFPPLIITAVHKTEIKFGEYWWLFIWVYLSLFLAISVVVFFVLIRPLAGTVWDVEVKLKDPLSACGVIFVVVIIIALFLAVPVLAGFATPKAVPCWLPKTRVDPVGPVPLPDPSESLNQFLDPNSSSANVTLKLCTTSNLNFYVGVPDNCSQIGEPYGGVKRPPFKGPKRPPFSDCPPSEIFSLGFAMILTGLLVVASTVLGVYFISLFIVASIVTACKRFGSRFSAKRVAPVEEQEKNEGSV